VIIPFLLSAAGCDATRARTDFELASALRDLPGRDPDLDERALLARTWLRLAESRGSAAPPPLVRVVGPEAFAELVAQQVATALRQDEELALRAVGLLGDDASLTELEAGAEPIAWLPARGLLAVREDAILDGARLEHALALALDDRCAPAANTRDARLAAKAVHEGLATLTVLDALLDERLVPLSRVPIDAAAVAEVLSEQAAWTGVHPLVAAERAWARERGTAVAARLHPTGGFRTLEATCAAPPAATQALDDPDGWAAKATLAPLAGPRVRAWEREGWRVAGEERLGRFTLDFWLRQLGPYGVLVERWRGDAVTVYQRADAVRAAWTVQLGSEDDAFMLASVLDGRTLRGGRPVATQQSGPTLTILVGGHGEVQLRAGTNPPGGRWTQALRVAPDLAAATVGRRIASAPALWENGLLRLGDRQVLLPETWTRAKDGVAGEVVTVANRNGRTRVEIALVPRVLAGSPRTAARQGLELARLQHGISGEPELDLDTEGATARIAGVDRLGRPHVLEVHAWERGTELLYVVARVQKAVPPKSYERLMQQLREL